MNETIWMREQLEAGKTADVIAYLRGLEASYEEWAEAQEEASQYGRIELEEQRIAKLCEEREDARWLGERLQTIANIAEVAW